ncbi:MAG: hypothetical protein H0X17_15690 [Deltaproteobacteria bacterium]|nr:hypothetical protein [Deltaproteobacteria bacterium]
MRNPFSVEDVPEPNGGDVEDFARSVRVPSDPSTDENALAWVAVATEGDGLDGPWTSRWRTGTGEWHQGVATVRVEGDRVFLLYKDEGTYLIDAALRGNRLVGRMVNVDRPADSWPWLGIVVDPYRIDGYFARGRWDLRRCSPDERPEPIVAALVTEARQLGAAELRELLGFARYLRWRGGEK